MKSRSFKKVICLILSLTIIISTALFITIISNAYVPQNPTSLSGLWANGEYTSYVYDGIAINLGYDESYVFQALGDDYTQYTAYDQYGNIVYIRYQYSDISLTCAMGSKVTNIRSYSSKFRYTVYDPVNESIIRLQVGSSKSLVRSTYGVGNLTESTSSYDKFVFGEIVVFVFYDGDTVIGFEVYDSIPYN